MLEDLEKVMEQLGGKVRSPQKAAPVMAPVEAAPAGKVSSKQVTALQEERDRLMKEKQDILVKAEGIQKKAREMFKP